MSIRLLFFIGILLLGYKAMAQRDSLSTKYRKTSFTSVLDYNSNKKTSVDSDKMVFQTISKLVL